MRNLFLCSGSTDRGPTCVRIKGQREGNGTLKRTEKTKDSCSLSERTHLASPAMYIAVHTVGAFVQKVCDWRREMGNLLLHSGPCFRKSKKAGDGLLGTVNTKALCQKKKKHLWLPHDWHGLGKINEGCSLFMFAKGQRRIRIDCERDGEDTG